MAIYVYKGGAPTLTPANILGCTDVVVSAVVPAAWYAQCGMVTAAPLSAEDKAALDGFMADQDQGWVYLRQDDSFTGFVQKRLDGWLYLGLAAGLVNVACARYGVAALVETTMPRAGSVVGVQGRLTAPILAGTLTVETTLDGVPLGTSVILTAASPSGFTRAAIGANPYTSSTLMGMRISTDALFSAPGAIFEGVTEVVE